MVQHDAAFADQTGRPPKPASGNGGISPRLHFWLARAFVHHFVSHSGALSREIADKVMDKVTDKVQHAAKMRIAAGKKLASGSQGAMNQVP
jgi:hypothetical protein